MKANKSAKKSAKKNGKPSANGAKPASGGKPQWKKIKLSGKLLSDEGGIGLEGLLGLEVLENAGDVLSVVKEKPQKVKREKFAVKEDLSGDESGSDDERSNKKKRRKKLQKKKKKEEEKNNAKNSADNEPGKFVRMMKADAPAADKAKKPKKGKAAKVAKSVESNEADPNEPKTTINDLIGWNGFGIAEPILRVMAEKKFIKPTEIQSLTFPVAILGRRDILGAAETGSGKTLAFGIPIINGILQMKNNPDKRHYRKLSKKNNEKENIEAVAEPKQHNKNKGNAAKMKANKRDREERDNWTPPPEEVGHFPDFIMEEAQNNDEANNKPTNAVDSKPLYALILTPTRELAVQVKDHLVTAAKYTGIRVAAVFGGLAAVKQERVLAKCPEIVVATPGRLWELICEGNKHLNKIQNAHFLVVDETDRMIEKGHFEELKLILERLNMDPIMKEQRQNFIFSATLTLMHELPHYLKVKNANRKRKLKPETSEQKLQTLIDYFGISQPKIIDITPRQTTGGTAKNLTECRISCSHDQKDLYLYYFLQKHPGRTIVFCNSIDCVRRVTKLFTILQCEPRALHAKMNQRQRLKNLERFTDSSTGLLVATDVAARGLDIPNVEHVIHYQVPRTSENYIHRSGRTARANREGITILLMEPEEVNVYVKLCRTLKRNEDLPIFPVAERFLAAVRERVNLATEIDIQELRLRRKQTDIGWLKKSAKEMDILIDDESDFSEGDLYDSDDGGGAIERSVEKRKLKQLQDSLKRAMAKPIFPKGFSYKYPSAIDIDANTPELVKNELEKSKSARISDNAVEVMKNAIEEYKIAKKRKPKY